MRMAVLSFPLARKSAEGWRATTVTSTEFSNVPVPNITIVLSHCQTTRLPVRG